MHAEARSPAPRRPSLPWRWCASAAALALLGGCASAPEAVVEADSGADLATRSTFAFARPLATDVAGQPSALSQHMEQATLREMRSRGFRQTSNMPQLIVNFNTNTTRTMPAVPSPPRLVSGGYYAYRDGQYTVWPGYRDRNAAAPYPAGTINIDIVDAANKQLVWEAVLPGAIKPGTSDPLQPAVDAAVKAAFAAYPKPPAAAGK